MSKKIITTDKQIIEIPHVAYIKLGKDYLNADLKDFMQAKRYLYKNAIGTVGFSGVLNGGTFPYAYIYFEKEEDLLYLLLKFQGTISKASIWKSAGPLTFYCVEQDAQHC